MKTTQQLNNFLSNISKNIVHQVINDNNLNLIANVEYSRIDKNAHIRNIQNNKTKYTYNLYTLLNISDVFVKNNISLITLICKINIIKYFGMENVFLLRKKN